MAKQSGKEKVLFVGDFHIRITPPGYRRSQYYSESLKMLSWIVEKALEERVEAILFGGDIGDSPPWSQTQIVDISEILSKAGLVYIVPGNHDVLGYNYDDWKYTGIGAIQRQKICQNVAVVTEPFTVGKEFSITPIPAGCQWKNVFLSGELVPSTNDRLNVAIAHLPVGPYTTPWMVGYKDITVSFDVAAFADIHESFGPYTSNTGCVLFNCGCLNRMTTADLGKVPTVAIIDSGGQVEFVTVPHISDAEAYNILTIEKLREDKKRVVAAGIAARQIAKGIDVPSYIREIAEKSGYSAQSVDILIKELLNEQHRK